MRGNELIAYADFTPNTKEKKYTWKNAKEIAEIYHLSRRTIEKHLESIRFKFKAKKISEAIYKAQQLGLMQL